MISSSNDDYYEELNQFLNRSNFKINSTSSHYQGYHNYQSLSRIRNKIKTLIFLLVYIALNENSNSLI